jgi:hypothetical protein
MSRGPGALQRRILGVLGNEPGERMWWRWLKERFPEEVADKNFYRAIRSLSRMGAIQFSDERSGHRYVYKNPYYIRANTFVVNSEELAEILKEASRQDRADFIAESRREWEEWRKSIPGVVT